MRAARPTAPALTRARPLLGTLVEVTVEGLAPDAAQEALERAFAEVERVHASMSFQSDHSELTHLNRHAWRGPVAVSQPLWEVLQAARELSRRSQGLFDITVASELVASAWLPAHAGLAPGTPAGGTGASWRDVLLLPQRQVRFARPLCIDLSGIAKGYAVDRALQVLQDGGARGGLVNAGGDLRCFGGLARPIHVRDPRQPTRGLPLLSVGDGAVATSAHYFARRREGARVWTRLIHPGRRTPLTEEISVTVLADRCVLADALTKVVHADAERALAVLAHFGAHALVLRPDPVGGGCLVYDTREPAAARS